MFRLKLLVVLFVIIFFAFDIYALEYLYILDDKCIEELYLLGKSNLLGEEIKVIKDSRGIILRLEFENSMEEIVSLSSQTVKALSEIKYFLAKIENPVIIEVHTRLSDCENVRNLKNWEVSTVIANKIEEYFTKSYGRIEQNRINSVGYGEFLPAKNTSNNGGKFVNRVDIMVLCSINGE